MSEGSARYDLVSSIHRPTIIGKDAIRPLLLRFAGTWKNRQQSFEVVT